MFFASLKQRFNGTLPNSTLEADLKQVTDSSVIEVPEELFAIVVEASQHGEDDRRKIMTHIRECLAETHHKRWRRVYAAMALIDVLMERGSPELVRETAEGRHFDLVQRLSLLEHFENVWDKRIQSMVRTRATALRAQVVARLEGAPDGERPAKKDTLAGIETASTCSPSVAPSLWSNSSSFGSDDVHHKLPSQARPEGLMILNGIVAVGHRDDTTSESSGGDAKGRAVTYKTQNRRSARERDSSTTTAPAPVAGSTVKAPAPVPVAPEDLLDL